MSCSHALKPDPGLPIAPIALLPLATVCEQEKKLGLEEKVLLLLLPPSALFTNHP